MAVARHAPCTRISGESSAGVATIMAFASPWAPRISSTNSRTSRPRSPTSETTITSASVKRVIIPNRVLLPTPLPANRPSRCPLPMVSKALIARTPTSRVSVIGLRFSGFIDSPRSGVECRQRMGPCPSIGLPAPSITRPSSCSSTATTPPVCSGTTRAPSCTPRRLPSGISIKLTSEKPTTSASMDPPPSVMIRQRLPIGAWQPTASSLMPIILTSDPSSCRPGNCTPPLRPAKRPARRALRPPSNSSSSAALSASSPSQRT